MLRSMKSTIMSSMKNLPVSVDELLDDVEALSHGERCGRLAVFGRELRGRPELPGILDGLAARGQYERFAALILARAAQETSYVVQAMRDPDPAVAASAIALAAKLRLPDDVIAEVVREAPMATRAVAYRALRRDGRGALAAGLVDDVRRNWGDREAAGLLVACGSEDVAERLGDLAHAVQNWSALAKRHPLVVLDHAEAVLAELPSSMRTTWWVRHGDGIAAAARHAPDRVIALLERYPTAGPPAACFGRLLKADPGRTLNLLLAPQRRGMLGWSLRQGAVRRRLAALPDATLGAVGRAVRMDEQALTNLLRALPPSRRADVFDAATAGVDLGQAELSAALLEVLPQARRAAEARRMMALRDIARNPQRVLELTAFLPYGEVEPALLAATRRSDAAERARGYRLLIACAGRSRDPEIVTVMLGSLGRLRNEQDPVRLSAVEALATLPSGLFEVVHLSVLEQMVDDALGARDASHYTRYALNRLATRIFEQGALREDQHMLEFALRAFERLTGHVGTIYLGPLSHVLRRGQEVRVVRRLAPFLAAEAGRDRYELAFALAAALGRRGHQVPELQASLERATRSAREATARTAIDLWLAPPRTRGERVAALVAMDPSAVTLRSVFGVISWHRTDLLHVALGARKPAGRFAKKNAWQLPYAPRGAVRRWIPRQREEYLLLLCRTADRTALPKQERATAIRMIGEVPAVEVDRLDSYLRSSDDLLRRAALTALPWTARPRDALAILLAHASGDDAHVAVYAATRAARFVRPADLAVALETVLSTGKITARKEAIRLLAGHRAPGAAGLLRTLWDQDGQHPDIRAAIVSATLELLDDRQTWRLLADAIAGAGDLAAPVLHAHPLNVPARWRQPYTELIVEAARSTDPDTRRTAIEALQGWAPFAPQAVDRQAEIVVDLAALVDWRAAARGLVLSACSGVGVAQLRAAIQRLASAHSRPDAPPNQEPNGEINGALNGQVDAQADRDRPAAQRLAAIGWELRSYHGIDRDAAESVLHAVADVLPADLAAELGAATMRWEDALVPLARLAGMPVDGVLAITEVGRILGESTEDVDDELVLPHAAWLTQRAEQRAAGVRDVSAELDVFELDVSGVLEARNAQTSGLLGLALVAECGPRAGWSAPWRELLRRLRATGSGEVAYAAARVYTATE